MIVDLVAVASFSVVLPLATCLLLYKRLPKPTKYILWLLACWLLAETIAYILRINSIFNWWVYVILSIFQIIFLTNFFREIIASTKMKAIFSWLGWTGIAILIVECSIAKGPSSTITSFYESIFYFGMGLYYFYKSVFEEKRTPDYTFLVATILMLFLGSTVFLCTWTFMKYDEKLFRLFGDTHAFLLISCYFLFTLSLWRLRL
jgi:hypothetical protein